MNLLSIPDLQRALVDPSPEVRRRSLAALPARWGSDLQDVIDLRTLLDESDDAILEMACFVVGECGPVPTTVVRRLIDIAGNHPDALCRESAVAALGSLGDPAGLDAILLACTDKPTIRRRAVLALVVFDDPRADAMLRSLADDVDWQVRQAAEELLAIGDGADSTGDLTNENP